MTTRQREAWTEEDEIALSMAREMFRDKQREASTMISLIDEEPTIEIPVYWCESCQDEYIGVCGHYEESRMLAEQEAEF